MLNSNALGKPIQLSHPHGLRVYRLDVYFAAAVSSNDGEKLDNPFMGQVSTINQTIEIH